MKGNRMTSRRSGAWVLAACVVTLGVPPGAAEAQGKKPAPASSKPASGKQKEEARGYLKSGDKAADAGQWEDAYIDYAVAWQLSPDWETAYSVGKAAFKTGKFAEAHGRLTFHLSTAPANAVPAWRRAEVGGLLKEATAKTGQMNIRVEPGTEVIVDNVSLGVVPLTVVPRFDPGKHKVEIRRGTSGQTKTVDVSAGATVEVVFENVKTTSDKANPLRTAGLVTGGVLTLGGFVIGGAFLGVYSSKSSALQEAEKGIDREVAKSAAQAKSVAINTALWGFVGAGVAAAGTAAFYFLTRPSQKAPAVKGSLGFTPAGPSILVEGRF